MQIGAVDVAVEAIGNLPEAIRLYGTSQAILDSVVSAFEKLSPGCDIQCVPLLSCRR
jgi:hypothetical protein